MCTLNASPIQDVGIPLALEQSQSQKADEQTSRLLCFFSIQIPLLLHFPSFSFNFWVKSTIVSLKPILLRWWTQKAETFLWWCCSFWLCLQFSHSVSRKPIRPLNSQLQLSAWVHQLFYQSWGMCIHLGMDLTSEFVWSNFFLNGFQFIDCFFTLISY